MDVGKELGEKGPLGFSMHFMSLWRVVGSSVVPSGEHSVIFLQLLGYRGLVPNSASGR